MESPGGPVILQRSKYFLADRAAQSSTARRLWNAWMRFGLDSEARFLSRIARKSEVDIEWGVKSVELRKGKRTIVLRHCTGEIATGILHFDQYFRSYDRSNRQIDRLDFSAAERHYSNELGKRIWFNSLPEPLQTCRGYFEKGLPPEGAVVFDCGAFCGETSLALSRLVGPHGRVLAFEPDGGNFECLVKNAKEDQATNLLPIRKGLWGSTGKVAFEQGAGLVARLVENAKHGNSWVDVLSYADACRLAGQEPDFVKMDIEGAEIEVIRAALPLLRTSSTRFAIASYHPVDGKPSAAALEEMFRGVGYEVETGNSEHLTTWAWRGASRH